VVIAHPVNRQFIPPGAKYLLVAENGSAMPIIPINSSNIQNNATEIFYLALTQQGN
jgi:hypothetical protein